MRKLLTAAVCLFAVSTAQAQFETSVEQVPRNDWAPESAVFPMNEVAQVLGTDATTLLGALDTWMAAAAPEYNMFLYAAPSAPDTWTDAYGTGGEKGFWIGADGELIGYPDGAYYANPGWNDEEGGTFSINIGMMPDALKYGTYNKVLKFGLRYGDKTATFTINFTVKGNEQVEIPEPATLLWQQVNVVAEKEVDIRQKPRSGYDADAVQVDLSDVTEKLGVPASVLSNEIGNLLYAKVVMPNDDSFFVLKDSLSNQSTAGAPGFWFHAVQNEQGEENGEVAAYNYLAEDKFYAEAFAFDAETGVLSCNVGQYPDRLYGGELWYAYVYIVYGDKAYRIRYNLNVIEEHLGTLEDYEKAGEMTIDIEMDPMKNYDTKNFDVDIETILAALGCDIADVDFYALSDDITFAKKNQDGVGYWYNMDGYVTPWGSSAMVYVTPKASDYSRFGIGQYPDHLEVGNELYVSIYFIGNGKYYKVTIHLTIKEPGEVANDFDSVAQRTYIIQQVPVVYQWTPAIAIPYDFVAEKIGTSDYTVYGLAALNEDGTEKEGKERYTKEYTCTPYPGFWLSADGRNNGWNSNARIGITASEDVGGFSMMQYEGDVCHIGDEFTTKLFLVNEENGKMVTFNFVYQIVETIQQIEVVGTESITLPVAYDEQNVTIDFSKAAESLGVSLDELLEGENLRGITEAGTYGEARTAEDGLAFNKDGVYDYLYALVQLSIVKTGDTVEVTTWAEETINDDFSLRTEFCFQVGEKRYVYEVRFVSNAIYFAGIESIATDSRHSNDTYDISGRKVVQPTHGIYIVNGKKVVR